MSATVSVVPLPGKPYFCHVGTRNTSFLKVSRILARNGVKNNKFFLALFDPELADIDPHDPDLSDEMQDRVLAECVRNMWYFVREVVRVPVSGPAIPFELHLGNLFLLWCMAANINCYLVLPRQNYKTVSACAFYLWCYSLATTNSHLLFFNKELGDSKNNLKRVVNLKDELPAWLQAVVTDPVADLNNIEYIQSGHTKNRIDAKPAGKDPAHADKLGRGATSPLGWYDELAFMKYNRDTYMAAAPAGSQAKASAAQFGRPYGTCVTTTPNNLDDPAGDFAYQLRGGSLRFRLEFYDLGPTRVRELIDTQAEYPFLYAEYTYTELGRSEAWFRTQCRELMNDMVKIKRELLLVWPMSGEGSVFAEEQLDRLRTYARPIVATIPVRPRNKDYVPPGLEVEFNEMPDPVVPYVVGVDTATGAGLDYCAFVFSHPSDMRQIGVIRSNTADDDAVKVIATHIFVDLFPNAVAVVERNHLGIVLINHLIKNERIEPRIFYLEKEKVAERTIGKQVLRTKSKVRVYGVDTTATSREVMMRHLFQIVDELPHLVTLEAVQDEIRTLQRKKTGKIEHRSGFHDDRLMAWLMAVYADRHDQPVLRHLLARVGSTRVQTAVNSVAVLNTATDVSPAAAVAIATGTQQIEGVEEYIRRAEEQRHDEAASRRRRLAGMVASLNMGGEMETPL